MHDIVLKRERAWKIQLRISQRVPREVNFTLVRDDIFNLRLLNVLHKKPTCYEDPLPHAKLCKGVYRVVYHSCR